MRILIADPIHPALEQRLRAAGHECTNEAGSMEQAEGIVVRSRVVDEAMIARAPALRFVARAGSGVENIDAAACERRGILIFSSPEGNRDGVAETCVMLLLMLLKHAVAAVDATRRGEWPREAHRGHELHGRTVGIIGFGNTGSAFAERLRGFGPRILAYDKYRSGYAPPFVEETSMDVLREESDVVSLHLPLNQETRHHLNSSFIASMRKPFWLLNTSRGPIVETRALLAALDPGRVLGAGLDVLEFERPDLSGLDRSIDPQTQDRLLRHPRVVITPHIAGVTHEGARKMAEALADKILNAFPHGR